MKNRLYMFYANKLKPYEFIEISPEDDTKKNAIVS